MPRTLVPSAVVALIENTFTWVTSGENPPQLSGDNAGELTGVVEAIEAIPPELIVLAPPDLAQFIAARGRLRHRIDTWVSRGPGSYNVNGVYVRQIRSLLTTCPDAIPAPTTTQLAFVTDVDLRDQLRIDIGWATQAFTNGDWKAATVLSGSIVEAMLLWALDHADRNNVDAAVSSLENSNVLTRRTPNKLNEWNLHQYAEVAGHLGLISAGSLAQVRLGKDFRNLIHPGRAIRLSRKCDRGTALASLAAVEMVASDL